MVTIAPSPSPSPSPYPYPYPYPSPYPTKPEMFQPDVMVEDDKWCPLGKMGKVRPLLFDVTNGGWVSILA